MWVRKRHVVRIEAVAAGEPAVELAEVDVEIFGLGVQLPAMANSRPPPTVQPTLVSLIAGEARLAGADVAERGTAGDVGHEPVEGVADAAADGAEPGVLGLAAERAAGVVVPLMLVQSRSPSRPNTQWVTCQL